MAARRELHTYQTVIPKLLKVFAKSTRNAEKWITQFFPLKRFDSQRGSLLELLDYVQSTTTKAHWEDIARLLRHFNIMSQRMNERFGAGARYPRNWNVNARLPNLAPRSTALKQFWRRHHANVSA